MAERRDGLARARTAAGYTQESLAEALGIDWRSVRRWEAGTHDPHPHRRAKLARLLNCDLRELDLLLDNRSPAPTPKTDEKIEQHSLRAEHQAPPSGTTKATQLEPELLNSLGWDMRDHSTRRTFFTQAASTIGTVLTLVSGNNGTQISPSQLSFDMETLEGLEQTTLGLRRAYRSAGALSLLDASHGTLNLLTEMLPNSGKHQDRLVAAIGQTASLIGVMLTLDLNDFISGERYLSLAARAGKQADNSELFAFSLGARAFHSAYSGDPSGGREYADSALKIAARGSSPIMRAWLSAVASEMYAIDNNERTCRRLLDAAANHLEASNSNESWSGVGVFNAEKLAAYTGGDLMRLGHYREAQQILHDALDKLDHSLIKHRCTVYIDLAEAYVADKQSDQAAHHTSEALSLVAITRHSASFNRIEKLYRDIRTTSSHAGAALGNKLIGLKATL